MPEQSPIGTAEYFEEIHTLSADPFGLRDRPYEKRKRAIALSLLGRSRYRRGLEVGCSMGAFTAALAARCDEVLALDRSASAIERANAFLSESGVSNVVAERACLPAEWPAAEFDLIVLSEIGYYLGAEELAELASRARGSLRGEGQLLAVHWRPRVDNCPLDGDGVHRLVAETTELDLLGRYEEDLFLAELYGTAGGVPTPE